MTCNFTAKRCMTAAQAVQKRFPCRGSTLRQAGRSHAVCGKCSQEEAVKEIQLASRRYAKRQLTWFRHQAGFKMLDISEFDNFEEIVNFVADMFEQSKNVI